MGCQQMPEFYCSSFISFFYFTLMSDQNLNSGRSDGPLTFPPLSRRWIISQMMSWPYLPYRCTQNRRSEARNKASVLPAEVGMFKDINFEGDISCHTHYLSENQMVNMSFFFFPLWHIEQEAHNLTKQVFQGFNLFKIQSFGSFLFLRMCDFSF